MKLALYVNNDVVLADQKPTELANPKSVPTDVPFAGIPVVLRNSSKFVKLLLGKSIDTDTSTSILARPVTDTPNPVELNELLPLQVMTTCVKVEFVAIGRGASTMKFALCVTERIVSGTVKSNFRLQEASRQRFPENAPAFPKKAFAPK